MQNLPPNFTGLTEVEVRNLGGKNVKFTTRSEFVRSGLVDTLESTSQKVFRGASVGGYTWPASTIYSTAAYLLLFGASDVYPSYNPNTRRFGYPLRCLSTTAVGAQRVHYSITRFWLSCLQVCSGIWLCLAKRYSYVRQ